MRDGPQKRVHKGGLMSDGQQGTFHKGQSTKDSPQRTDHKDSGRGGRGEGGWDGGHKDKHLNGHCNKANMAESVNLSQLSNSVCYTPL